MNTELNTKPIKTVMDLHRWESELLAHCSEKIHVFFRLGLDTGMLPGILQNLKWSDLKEEKGDEFNPTRTYFEVASKMEWSKPFRKIYLPDASLMVLSKLRKNNPNDIYIFQTTFRATGRPPKPLTIQRITVELKQAAINCGIISKDEPLGVITLRKSFGYHHIVHGQWTVHEMKRYFEQRSLKITKEYLCLPDDVILGATPRKRPASKD